MVYDYVYDLRRNEGRRNERLSVRYQFDIERRSTKILCISFFKYSRTIIELVAIIMKLIKLRTRTELHTYMRLD